jgi:hypothetical protein
VAVVAAGNEGFGSAKLNPAYNPHVLAVGAADTAGTWSGRTWSSDGWYRAPSRWLD